MGEKLKPLVIGKAKNPRAFKQHGINLANLPLTWTSNKKAWMMNVIFTQWLEESNVEMKRRGRKILLFVENASSDGAAHLSNIRVEGFPPNMTAMAQPLDLGIIQTFKLNYRKELLTRVVTAVDLCESAVDFSKQIHLFDTIR